MNKAPPRPDPVLPVLGALHRYARAFDEISNADEGQPRYTAAAFVEWIKREASAPRREAS